MSKYFSIVFFTFFYGKVVSQRDSMLHLSYKEEDLKVERKLTLSAASLATALTKNKSSDKEKFDAIFCVGGNPYPLRFQGLLFAQWNRRNEPEKDAQKPGGICLDYSTLMDTLVLTQASRMSAFTATSKTIFLM